jgi:hypothetical protein
MILDELTKYELPRLVGRYETVSNVSCDEN